MIINSAAFDDSTAPLLCQPLTLIYDYEPIFIYPQNAKGKTIASVFSARPSVSATVSMPVKWKELDNILPSDFTIVTVPNILLCFYE
jgi:LigD-like primase-polymerase